jgi:hypothetical protein
LPTALAVASICVGVLVLIFMVMNSFQGITFQQFGGATPFITLAGFAVTVIQLYNGNSEARASFLKTYTTDFILKPELYGTWHDLIYGYSNTVYAVLDAHVRQHGAYPTEIQVPGEAAIAWKPEYWHPRLFQTTQEERRIDAVLGYIDVIGYYQQAALIDVMDISGLIGEFLQDIRSRTMIYDYFVVIWRAWELNRWQDRQRQDPSVRPPFLDFVRMLAALPSREPGTPADRRAQSDDAIRQWKDTSRWHAELLLAFRPGTY